MSYDISTVVQGSVTIVFADGRGEYRSRRNFTRPLSELAVTAWWKVTGRVLSRRKFALVSFDQDSFTATVIVDD